MSVGDDLFEHARRLAREARREAGDGSCFDPTAAATMAAAQINAIATIFSALVTNHLAEQIGAVLEAGRVREDDLQTGQ